jgi:hypothetical protein
MNAWHVHPPVIRQAAGAPGAGAATAPRTAQPAGIRARVAREGMEILSVKRPSKAGRRLIAAIPAA